MNDKEKTIERPRREHCSCCIMPEAPDHVVFDDEGVCDICRRRDALARQHGSFGKTDGEQKLNLLKKKVNRFRNDGPYDCVCSVSGGKDSLMTLYIAKKILGLRPLAVRIDSGFSLPEMPENLANATDALGIDSVIFKVSDIQDLFKLFLKSKRRIYYCRLCHALLDWKIHEIAQRFDVKLILGGYTKGQQYIRNSELFWIYDVSDKNAIDLLSEYPQYRELTELVANQTAFFHKRYPEIAQISPFKYVKWDEREIVELLTKELGFKRSSRSWPTNSSNCLFNHVSQYLAEKDFGYAQHEVELSELVRDGEMTRQRALDICESPISGEAIEESLEKLGLSMDALEGERKDA